MVAAINTIRSMARPEASQMRFVVRALSLKSTMLFIHDHNPGLLFLKQYSPTLAEAAKIFDKRIVLGFSGSLGKQYIAMGFHGGNLNAEPQFKADPVALLPYFIKNGMSTGVTTGIKYTDVRFPFSAVS